MRPIEQAPNVEKDSDGSAEQRKEDATKFIEDLFAIAHRQVISSILPSKHPDIRQQMEEQYGFQLTDSLILDFFRGAFPKAQHGTQGPLSMDFEDREPASSDSQASVAFGITPELLYTPPPLSSLRN